MKSSYTSSLVLNGKGVVGIPIFISLDVLVAAEMDGED